MVGFFRIAASIFSGLVSALFLLMAVTLPFTLRDQALQDRAYYQQFKQAAAYAADYARTHKGRLPDENALRALKDTTNARSIWASLSFSDQLCDGGFRQGPTDQFTLWFWRGEWAECFAYPSEKTTLPMSVSAYLLGGLGVEWAVYWLIGGTAAFAAFRLARRQMLTSRAA